MYKSFEVKKFRCFDELKISGLKRINLITGMNNIGKTALLEAIFLHCGAFNPTLALRVNTLRGIEILKIELGKWTEAPWESLFYQWDLSNAIELDAENSITGRRSVQLKALREPLDLARAGELLMHDAIASAQPALFPATEKGLDSSEGMKVLELQSKDIDKKRNYYLIVDAKGIRSYPTPPSPPFPCFYLTFLTRALSRDEVERYGKLEIEGKENKVVQALKIIEPRLQRVSVIVIGEPIFHGDIGGKRLIPLPLMGGGMVRLANLIINIGSASNGVVLVDEIENGFHHSILTKVWNTVAEAAKEFNVQVFATTHSMECITAAHEAFSKTAEYDFGFHRLERTREKTLSKTYDLEALGAAIDTGFEVR
jgi:AAA15 family ATPase/GTPase